MPEAKKSTEIKKTTVKKLSEEEQAKIVEEYLGVHPKYFIYEGLKIQVDIWNLEHDGLNWRGFKPHLKELGEL